ncbi:MAG: hypothetical protein HQL97_10675 [Magnetococcales bacterium]|nr:hypothetical protein [Magnetococcales bacterium]
MSEVPKLKSAFHEELLELELQALRDERDRLAKALQPFAERWEYFERTKHPSGGEWPEDLEYADDEPSTIYLGQLKAAKAALTPAGGGQQS